MMTTPLASAQLSCDLAVTLGRLRIARTVGDKDQERVQEKRLNWLLDKIPRKVDSCLSSVSSSPSSATSWPSRYWKRSA